MATSTELLLFLAEHVKVSGRSSRRAKAASALPLLDDALRRSDLCHRVETCCFYDDHHQTMNRIRAEWTKTVTCCWRVWCEREQWVSAERSSHHYHHEHHLASHRHESCRCTLMLCTSLSQSNLSILLESSRCCCCCCWISSQATPTWPT